MNKSYDYKCVIFDLDENGFGINYIYLTDERPEKIYDDHVYHYGDKRSYWRKLIRDNKD